MEKNIEFLKEYLSLGVTVNIDNYEEVITINNISKELNKKVEELERRLNKEPTEHTESVSEVNKSDVNVDGNVESEPKTND